MANFIKIGCIRVDKDYKDPESKIYGRLTTIGPRFLLPRGKKVYHRAYVVCQCECGSCTVVDSLKLKSGHTQSCGCLQSERTSAANTKHGMRDVPEYTVWNNMRRRCNYKGSGRYYCYGARGITVCPEWDNIDDGFQNFYNHMGPRPSPRHEIERKNVNGNYCPENCCWLPKEDQARNKRATVNITYNDKTQCVTAWAEELGVNAETLYSRIKSGWSVEKVLTTPVKKRTVAK